MNRFVLVNGVIYLAIVLLFLARPLPSEAANCTMRATKQCISNIVYWYDSCGALQEVAQNCNLTNQLCQQAQCVNKATLPTQSATTPTPAPASQPTSTQTQNQAPDENIAVALFAKKETGDATWDKNITAAVNDKIDFLLVVKNTSAHQLDNVLVTATLTDAVAYTGNLKIGTLSSAGNIASGVAMGSLPPKASEVLSFTATAAAPTNQGGMQIIATANASGGAYDSDFVVAYTNAQISPGAAPTTITTTATAPAAPNSFVNNLKKNWYIWVIILIILAVVFIIIFRRLSSNV